MIDFNVLNEKSPEDLERMQKAAGVVATLAEAEKRQVELASHRAAQSRSRRILSGLGEGLKLFTGIAGVLLGYIAADYKSKADFEAEREKIKAKTEAVEKREKAVEQTQAEVNVKLTEAKADESAALKRKEYAELATSVAVLEAKKLGYEITLAQTARDKALESFKAVEEELIQKIQAANATDALKSKRMEEMEVELARKQQVLADADAALTKIKGELATFSLSKQQKESVVKLAEVAGAAEPAAIGGMATEDASTSADARKLAADLFSTDRGKRLSAYDKLTGKEKRSLQSTAQSVLDEGMAKLAEYESKKEDETLSKEDELLYRRGLENAVVTLRDMSRSVTQTVEFKEPIKQWAVRLKELDRGVAEEAEGLIKWLDSRR